MNTSPDTHPSRSNDLHARALVDKAIRTTPLRTPVPEGIARIIAAAAHRTSSSALGRFAASGRLNRAQARHELHNLHPDQLPADWWTALDDYLAPERRS